MSLGLPEIEAFVAVVRLGTFTAAAKEVHISQPALSRRIRAIEDVLRAPLFERLPNGPKLTSAGEKLLPHAEAVLLALREALDAARGIDRGEGGQVSVVAVSALCTERLLKALRQFQAEAPEIELALSFQAKASDSVSDEILRGEATWGLRYGVDPRLYSEVIGTERLLIVCAPDHALAGLKYVAPRRLAKQTWISYPLGPGMSDIPEGADMLPSTGRADRETLIIDSIAAQKALIQAGFGIGLMPRSTIVNELHEESLSVVDVADFERTVPIVLVRRKAAFVGGTALHLAQKIIEAYSGAGCAGDKG